MAGDNADGFRRYLKMPRDEHAHTLVGSVISRRLAHEYLQRAFLPLFHKLLARIGPYLHANQFHISHFTHSSTRQEPVVIKNRFAQSGAKRIMYPP